MRVKKVEHMDSVGKAQHFFDEKWAPERRRILKDLKSIKDEVQRQATVQSIGSITYSSVGIVGEGLVIAGIITAPFTLGVSLGLTAAGLATELTSGVAGVIHGAVKFGIVIRQCKNAKTSLMKHNDSCVKMRLLLELLKRDIKSIEKSIVVCHEMKNSYSSIGKELAKLGLGVVGVVKNAKDLVDISKAVNLYRIVGSVDEVDRLLSIGKVLDDMLPSVFKDVSNGNTKLSTPTSSVLAAVGILIDVICLIWNAFNLSKFKKGSLCSEAEKLQSIIEQMQQEYDVLTQFFYGVTGNAS